MLVTSARPWPPCSRATVEETVPSGVRKLTPDASATAIVETAWIARPASRPSSMAAWRSARLSAVSWTSSVMVSASVRRELRLPVRGLAADLVRERLRGGGRVGDLRRERDEGRQVVDGGHARDARQLRAAGDRPGVEVDDVHAVADHRGGVGPVAERGEPARSARRAWPRAAARRSRRGWRSRGRCPRSCRRAPTARPRRSRRGSASRSSSNATADAPGICQRASTTRVRRS